MNEPESAPEQARILSTGDVRRSLRAQCALPAQCIPISSVGMALPPLPATVLDISAGGARLVVPRHVEPTSVVRLVLSVAEPLLDLNTLARVLRAQEDREGAEIATSFIGLEFASQVAVTRWVLLSSRASQPLAA